MRDEFDHLDDAALEFISQGAIHRKVYPERVQRMEIELAHRKAKKRMQELARFNMENDTKLGTLPRTTGYSLDLERWKEAREGFGGHDDGKCKCDIHQLMRVGHDTNCREKSK